MSGAQIVREYRGGGRFAHPAAEPVSADDLHHIRSRDVAANKLESLHSQRVLRHSIEAGSIRPAKPLRILG